MESPYVYDIEVPVSATRKAMQRLTPINIERHVPLFVRGHSVTLYQMHDIETGKIYVHPTEGVDTFHFASAAGISDPDAFYAQARNRFTVEVGGGQLSEHARQYLKRVSRANRGDRRVGDYKIVEPWLFQRYGLHGNTAALLESKLRYRIQPASGPVVYSYADDMFIERAHRYSVATVALDSIAEDFTNRQEAILQRIRGK